MADYGGCLWSWHRASGPWGRVAFPLPQPTRPPPPAAAAKIQNDLRILTERLARINDNLARKISSRNEYDKTIQETEAAYAKVRPPRAAPPIRHGHSTCLACGRASTCTSAAATAPGGGGCVRAAAPVLVRVDHGEPTLACPFPDRSWRVPKRCCTCSSGRASTSRRRSRRRRRRLCFRTFLAGSLWR